MLKKQYNDGNVAQNEKVFTFIATKEIFDHDGDLIKIDGINTKTFEKNPIIFFNHKHSDLPIGKALSLTKKGNRMDIDIEFADHPFAKYVKNWLRKTF